MESKPRELDWFYRPWPLPQVGLTALRFRCTSLTLADLARLAPQLPLGEAAAHPGCSVVVTAEWVSSHS